jgi:hypothetical protein
MPFYFALPRTGNTGSQGRQNTGRVEYLRTAPTTLTFTTQTLVPRVNATARDNIHALAMSAIAGEKSGSFDRAFQSDVPCRLIYPKVPREKVLQITLPRMSFRFGKLSDTQIERLDELGVEERNIKGKGKIWVGALNPLQAAELVEFGVSGDYAALGGTISVRGADAVNKILRLVSLSAQVLTLSADRTGTLFGVCTSGDSQVMPFKGYTVSTLSESISNDDYGDDAGVEFEYKQLNPDLILARAPLPLIHGPRNDIVTADAHGIFCPFEPNYSGTDRRAVHTLLSDFSQIASDLENFDIFDKELCELWSSEVCLTMEGEFIAHMIASLSLAKRICAKISFLVTGSLYEGAVLFGADEFSFKLVGGMTYHSLETTALHEDIQRYAFHSTTLRDILRMSNIGDDVRTRDIKTMRQLRTIIMGKMGHAITPGYEATLKKQLIFLNFREKPEPVNPTSLGKLFSFIHPTAPAVIPESVYLDRRAFFSQDTVELALSMFGVYVPSPIITGQTLVLAVSPSSNKKTSNEPPAIQFCLKELSVSAKDWEGFLRGGCVVQPATKIRKGRRFAGTDKTQIWGSMTTLAAAGISSKKNENVAIRNDREVEKRDRDDGHDPRASDKRMKYDTVDFSIFG